MQRPDSRRGARFFCLYPASQSWWCRLCFPRRFKPLKRLMGQAVMVCRWLSVKYDALVCLVVWQSTSESVQGVLVVVVFATPLPNNLCGRFEWGGVE